MKNIAVVGAGISGLTMAFHLLKSQSLIPTKRVIDIYQINSFPGGRIHTNIFDDSKTGLQYHFDVGANLIDFSSEQS